MITAGVCQADGLVVIYSDPEARVLAFGTGPGHNDLSMCFVWTFASQIFHWTCICGIGKE